MEKATIFVGEEAALYKMNDEDYYDFYLLKIAIESLKSWKV